MIPRKIKPLWMNLRSCSMRFFPISDLGLLHGRMKPSEKDEVMQSFNHGEIDILISTSVVEVGVDVPNATVMLVEGANRFGLAQLHQFRGRVGRGDQQSFCLLIPETDDAMENERLKAMSETNDGFILAEKDLQQRGPGSFLGTRQSGFTDLKFGDITDVRLIEKARNLAKKVFEQDPDLTSPQHKELNKICHIFWQDGKRRHQLMVRAVFPGSFDPIHYGHIDIATRASRLFDELIIAVYDKTLKNSLFNPEERILLVQKAFAENKNIRIMGYSGLTVEFCRKIEAQVIVRGLRVFSDFEHEFRMALANHRLASDVETVPLITSEDHMFLSSTTVREIASLNGNISSMVPPYVAEALMSRYSGMDENLKNNSMTSLRD